MKSTELIDELVPLREPTFLILLSLSAGERHGYAILKEVEELSSGKVVMSTGTLYEALARLLKQGLIARVEAAQMGQQESHPGRPRKIYRLSPLGRRVLKVEASRMQNLVVTAQRRLGEISG